MLKEEGLKACPWLGYDSVIVLRHPEYYPKFGFEPAGKWGIKDLCGAPAEALYGARVKEKSS